MATISISRTAIGFASITALIAAPALLAQGGDTPLSANVIGALPFSAAGTTVNFTDDHDEVCPYSGSTSPDVFYAYSATGETIAVDLCNSQYDTKTYVYDSALALVTTVNGEPACNDDFCSSPNGGAFRSFIGCVPVDGTVYIAVDGWLGDRGDYGISIEHQDPAIDCVPSVCIIECPTGAILEPDDCLFGEPDPNDQVNGGCNADPPAFTSLECGQEFCGRVYFDGTFRDTEWFAVADHPHCTLSFHISGIAEFNAIYGRIDVPTHDPDCDQVAGLAEFVIVESCEPVSLETGSYDPGVGWLFVAPDFTQLIDCNQPSGGPPNEVGAAYTFRADCNGYCPPCAWDFDGDNQIGFQDLLKILSNWGPCPIPDPCPWDADGDNGVGFPDLLKILSNWGPCPS